MTMPAAVATAAAAAQIELPEPDFNYPIVTLVVSDPIFPTEAKPKTPPSPPSQQLQQQAKCPHCQGPIYIPAPTPAPQVEADIVDPLPVYWALSKPHPFVSTLKIVRMHRLGEVVYIFSLTNDMQVCIIDELPFRSVRLVERSMGAEVFVGELEEADEAAPVVNAYDPDADDGEGGDPEPPPAPNGTQATSNSVPS